MLWLGVPAKVFKRYAADNEYLQEALELINTNRCGTTVFYKKDMSLKRWVLLKYMFHNYVPRYKKYFAENKGQADEQ
ncbi:probably carbamoylphosphate synthase large subunit, evidenced by COGnitor [Agrilactobacillus composti DSM 18527 = JCM 14202]|nr:probably carbamoylphosphate synthase large subunit, evidenced by COGnitor [Agrilactobacillus composti DSM 18527 = JCM 14202]